MQSRLTNCIEFVYIAPVIRPLRWFGDILKDVEIESKNAHEFVWITQHMKVKDLLVIYRWVEVQSVSESLLTDRHLKVLRCCCMWTEIQRSCFVMTARGIQNHRMYYLSHHIQRNVSKFQSCGHNNYSVPGKRRRKKPTAKTFWREKYLPSYKMLWCHSHLRRHHITSKLHPSPIQHHHITMACNGPITKHNKSTVQIILTNELMAICNGAVFVRCVRTIQMTILRKYRPFCQQFVTSQYAQMIERYTVQKATIHQVSTMQPLEF